jgi:serine-type D-Ala-D-Ala carboxypeptidase (penicillin-binding protein 5/6)
MKKNIFTVIFFLSLIFFPYQSRAEMNEEKRATLIEQLELLMRKVSDLRWQLEKSKVGKELTASSYLIVDLSNNFAILNRDHQKKYPLASVTKLMTGVITLENLDADDEITLASKMLEPYGFSPAIHLGKNITAKDLMKAALIQSTNDAAESLTYFLNEGEFVLLMNEKAKELGMYNTFFNDAHGLSYSNSSSALDIFRLLTHIKENHPNLLEITREENFQLEGECVGKICTFKNLNLFHGLSEFIGGKTGYLPLKADQQNAGQTFAGIFQFKEVPYAIILLNSRNRTSDVQKISDWLKKRP